MVNQFHVALQAALHRWSLWAMVVGSGNLKTTYLVACSTLIVHIRACLAAPVSTLVHVCWSGLRWIQCAAKQGLACRGISVYLGEGWYESKYHGLICNQSVTYKQHSLTIHIEQESREQGEQISQKLKSPRHEHRLTGGAVVYYYTCSTATYKLESAASQISNGVQNDLGIVLQAHLRWWLFMIRQINK